MEFTQIDELRNLYFDKSKEAKRGKKILDRLLRKADDKPLKKLLRYHIPNGITDAETWDRDDVDFFLNYFSVLSLSMICNFIRIQDLDSKIRKDIRKYLGNPTIRAYYTDHYPIILPQILLSLVELDKDISLFKHEKVVNEKFYLFHTLNQSIDDDNIYQFLWFLDGGENESYDIDSLDRLLRRPEGIGKVLKGKNNALRKALLGFFNYLVFIERFSKFLNQTFPGFERSLYWHYHGYWFKKIASKLSDSIEIFFYSMEKFIKENKDDKIYNSEEWFLGLQVSRKIYLDAVDFMLDKENEIPLVKYRDSLQNAEGNLKGKSGFEESLKNTQTKGATPTSKIKVARKKG